MTPVEFMVAAYKAEAALWGVRLDRISQLYQVVRCDEVKGEYADADAVQAAYDQIVPIEAMRAAVLAIAAQKLPVAVMAQAERRGAVAYRLSNALRAIAEMG